MKSGNSVPFLKSCKSHPEKKLNRHEIYCHEFPMIKVQHKLDPKVLFFFSFAAAAETTDYFGSSKLLKKKIFFF